MKKVAFFLLSVFLASCASNTPTTMPQRVFYAPGAEGKMCAVTCSFPLKKELIEAKYAGKTEKLIAISQCNQGGLSITLLSAIGVKLVTIEAQQESIAVTKYLPIELPFRAEQLINDILLCTTDVGDIKKALPTGWNIKIENDNRYIASGKGEPVIEVTKTFQGYQIFNKAFRYSVKISPLE